MRFALLGVIVALCGCGSSPQLARSGPRIEAKLAATWSASAPARQVAFSRDGGLLATSDAAGLITIRDTADWKVQRELRHPGGATSVVFSKSGSALFSGGYDGAVRLWSLRDGRQTGALNGARGTVWTIDVSPDGGRLAAAGEDSIIRVRDLAKPLSTKLLRGHERNVWEARFSPDGSQIASGSFDESVRLWNVATGHPIRTILGHRQAVVGLDYSPDGKLVATGSDDSTIRLWRASDGAPMRTIDNGAHVDKVAFSPDGRWLASGGHAHGTIGGLWHQVIGGGGDGDSVRLWRVADGALVANLPHPDDVIFVAFSRDGRWLVTSGEDNRFRLWRLSAAAS